MAFYRIADLTVQMDVSGRILQQAAPYEIPACDRTDIRVSCDPQRILDLNPSLENLDDAQYVGTGANFARQLLNFGGFQLHASAVLLDGKAYLFSANSGTGKSTHTEKWCRLFGAIFLNDDKPALRKTAAGWMAYGTPWSGKHDLSTPVGVPLGGIAFLERGDSNTICPMDVGDAVPRLISQTPRHLPRESMGQQLDLLNILLQDIPVWRFACRNEDEAAWVSRNAMTGVGNCEA